MAETIIINPYEILLDELRQIKNMRRVQSENEVINAKELRRRLNISPPTEAKLRKHRKIQGFRVGREWKYNWGKVLQALEEPELIMD